MIEFALYKSLENASDQSLSKVKLFSTQFYTQLTKVPTKSTESEMSEAQRNHRNVMRWTKNENIFNKSIHFYPINEEESHWYLIVVILPDKGFKPYIAVLDSIGGSKSVAVENIKKYLLEELKCKKSEGITAQDITEMKTVYPKIPRQSDGSSCGLYVIHYVQQILGGSDLEYLSSIFKDTCTWFKKDELENKRFEIAGTILDMVKNQGNLKRVNLPDLQFFPTAAQDKQVKRIAREKNPNKTQFEAAEARGKEETNVRQSYLCYINNLKKTQKDITLRRVYHIDG